MGQFLIPANSKKSMLILSFFNLTDLIIFGVGCSLTFILLMAVDTNDLTNALLVLVPALVTGFLIIPVPYHHNVRTLIGNIYSYFTRRRTYYWRGWCMRYGEKTDR